MFMCSEQYLKGNSITGEGIGLIIEVFQPWVKKDWESGNTSFSTF